MMINEMIQLIHKYEMLIEKGNRLLQEEYNFKVSPLLARREGVLPLKGELERESMKFCFHGIGCTFEFGHLVVDFDYVFGTFIYGGFEVSKLYRFFESHFNGTEKPPVSRQEFNSVMDKLENGGIIKRKDEYSYDTYDYRLMNFEVGNRQICLHRRKCLKSR